MAERGGGSVAAPVPGARVGQTRGPRSLRGAARSGAKPPWPWVPEILATVAGLGLGATVAITLTAETQTELVARGGIAMFLGNLTALVGTYLALLMVVLVGRVGFVERAIGQDRLVAWHRRLGPWPLSLISAHVLFTTIGYAQAARTGIWHEIGVFLSSYPDMLVAFIGFGLMLAAGFASIRALRERMRRETWWRIHLVLYLALALAFVHEIVLGPSFVGHPLTTAVWSLAWAATAGLVIGYRWVLPLVRSLRHQLRVVQVRPEGPGVTSVLCSGRDVERLRVAGGQFFQWRFLARGLWWQAHPYSLSALPQGSALRLTVKDVGDHSSSLARLRPGTRVIIEGPYGAFTTHARQRTRVLLIAGGIGITAVRALLEDLPRESRPIVLVRASAAEELVLRAETAELVRRLRGQLHELTGSRTEVALDAQVLRELVPDITSRDVFVCGPAPFVRTVVEYVTLLGVPAEAIHHEAFAL